MQGRGGKKEQSCAKRKCIEVKPAPLGQRDGLTVIIDMVGLISSDFIIYFVFPPLFPLS